jgi:ribosomal protein S2
VSGLLSGSCGDVRRVEAKTKTKFWRETIMPRVELQQLLEAGVHFGHLTPKVESEDEAVYLYGEKRHSYN